jgi:hypothetical protein
VNAFVRAQVDIFSLAIVMFELFSMNLMANIAQKSGDGDEFELYAQAVASGHREPLKDAWPDSLKVCPDPCVQLMRTV